VRTRNRAYKRELALVDMPNVYQALNAIQATAWKVNVPV
jgi:DNA-directed RNA polymerase